MGSADTFYYLTDGLGSTMALTDDAGDVDTTWDYDVFGAVRDTSGGQPNDFQFAGEQVDGSTDLQYLRARYYDPAVGRFVSRDSWPGTAILPVSMNRFSYVINNPLILIDPTGMCPFPCIRLPDPVGDVRRKAEDAIGWAGDQIGVDGSYVSFDITACPVTLVPCFQGGIQYDGGVHPYVGTGTGTPGGSVSITAYPDQKISEGVNCGAQGNIPVNPAQPFYGATLEGGATGQGPKEGSFAGVGVWAGTPGGAFTCYYVFPDVSELPGDLLDLLGF